MIEDDNLFKKYSDIWNNVSNIITKKNTSTKNNNNNNKKNKLKTKRKSYNDDTTYFLDKEIPKVGSNYTCLAVKKFLK